MFSYKLRETRVEAVQWGDGQVVKPEGTPIPDWLRRAINDVPPGEVGSVVRYNMDLYVHTPTGVRLARNTDWVMYTQEGNLNVWHNEEFQQCFDKAEPVKPGIAGHREAYPHEEA